MNTRKCLIGICAVFACLSALADTNRMAALFPKFDQFSRVEAKGKVILNDSKQNIDLSLNDKQVIQALLPKICSRPLTKVGEPFYKQGSTVAVASAITLVFTSKDVKQTVEVYGEYIIVIDENVEFQVSGEDIDLCEDLAAILINKK